MRCSCVLSLVLSFVITVLITTSCSGAMVGELQTESRAFEIGSAESVEVNIEIGTGSLAVSGGTEKLLQADFEYNIETLKPEIEFVENEQPAKLSIRQPKSFRMPFGKDFRYDWKLYLNNNIPMDLNVKTGAGRSNMNLSGLSLNNLKIDAGVGDLTVDFSGNWRNNVNAEIKCGVGDTTIKLPYTVGIKVDVGGGIGEVNFGDLTPDGSAYINDAFGKSRTTLIIDVHAGVGTINLVVVR